MRILILILSIGLGFIYRKNAFLFGQRTGMSHEGWDVIVDDPVLDDELFGLAKSIKSDFEAYRNHCLRVMTFTQFFLPASVEKEIPKAMELVATALAYHDVALWTDKALSYLDPSVAQMEKALAGSEEYSESDMAIMKDIILQHHKITDFKSDRGAAADALVNAVRKADWADATMGVIRFGLPAVLLEAAYDKIPEAGFHKILGAFPGKLSSDFLGMFDILNILKF